MPRPAARKLPVEKIGVGLVEDDAPFRAYLGTVLAASGRYALAAEAGSVEAALAWPARRPLAVLLLDIALPGRTGSQAVGDFLAARPALKIVMLTGRDGDEPLLAAIRGGAAGYLLKGASSEEIVEALDDVLAGGAPMSPGIARRVLALLREPEKKAGGEAALAALSPREREVLALVAEGCADKEICARLGVTRSTVKNHLTAIYDKWRVRSRTQAALRFVKVTGK
ncbi:MAG: response regulator transcription factor [Opitutae bacterium]|nr:response regulator transcription factor [Opitutae bacterium]